MNTGWAAVRIGLACMLFVPGLVVLIAGLSFEVSLDHRVLAGGAMICGIALFYVAYGILERKRKMAEIEIPPRGPYRNTSFHEIDGHVFVVFTDKDGKYLAERELPKGWTIEEYMTNMGMN